MGGRFRKEQTYVYFLLIHVVVWQKPTQLCKVIILQLKINLKIHQEDIKIKATVNISSFNQFSSVQLLSHVQLFETPWTAARQASLSITNSWTLLKLMSIKLVMPSNYLILCRPLLFLPSIFLSIRVFSNESVLHIRWSKYWSFRFSISPSNEYSGLISFRIDWFDLLAVQGTLKNFLQHHSSKASILRCSAFPLSTVVFDYIKQNKWSLKER